MKYKIVKIGWENENDVPIVCINNKDRKKEEVDCTNVVKIDTKQGQSFAIVQKQFNEFVGKDKQASISKVFADELKLKVGDTITLSKEVTETQHGAFMAKLQEQMQRRFMFVFRGN